MSKARGLADLGNAYSDGALSNRNLIINGAMQVAQRGTSLTGIGNNNGGPFICDRFQHVQGSGGGSGVLTMEQSADAADGFGSSLKLTVTTADTLSGGENVGIRYRSEGQDGQSLKFGTSSAEKFTVSFWAKASLAGTYSLQIFGPGRSVLSSYTINSANTWEYKTITFNGDTSVALPNTNAAGFEVIWHLDAGSSDITSAYDWADTGAFRAATGQVNFMATNGATWQITGVQLEVGDTATPFEHRSYGDELQRCQRYYYTNDSSESNGSYYRLCDGMCTTSVAAVGVVRHPVEMRVKPTFIASAAGTWATWDGVSVRGAANAAEPSADGETRLSSMIALSGLAGQTQFRPIQILANANKNAFIAFDAEL